MHVVGFLVALSGDGGECAEGGVDVEGCGEGGGLDG